MSDNPIRPRTGIQSVSRACRILLAIAAADTGLSAREVSTAQGLTLPTTYNILSTLCDEGLLAKRADHRFVLGPARFVFADAVHRNPGASPEQLELLRALASRTGETTYLSAWQGDTVVILASVEGSEPLRVAQLRPGFSTHMHARASAKLMLALASEGRRERVLDLLVFQPLTENTITDREMFVAELESIRTEGIAFDRQEYHQDIAGISAGIIEAGHVTASLTIAVPAQRFSRKQGELREALLSVLRG
ncbi:MAG: IclR family transcriptional regulator [Candidatus Nanopelagicales bacterium]